MEAANEAADERAGLQDQARIHLSSRVAITVALLATFLGVCKVKDDNIVQARQQAQADKLDHWNFYPARNIRQEVAAAAAAQLKLAALTHKPWLYWFALVPTAAGVVMGLAGLFGWHLHPDALARLLS